MVLVSSRYLSLYPEVKDPERRTYLAMVTHMDHVVGEVVKALKTTNQVLHTRMLHLQEAISPLQCPANRPDVYVEG